MSEPKKVTKVTYTVSGTYYYDVVVDPDANTVLEAPEWPTADNTDGEIVRVEFEDGAVLDSRPGENPDGWKADQDAIWKLEEDDEFQDKVFNATCEEWPQDRQQRLDAEALDKLNVMLSAPEWSVSMLEDACAIVRATGRQKIEGAEWERH